MDKLRLLRLGLRAGALLVCLLGIWATYETVDTLLDPGVSWAVVMPWEDGYRRIVVQCDETCRGAVGLLQVLAIPLALLSCGAGLAGLLSRRRAPLLLASGVVAGTMLLLFVDDHLVRSANAALMNGRALPTLDELLGLMVLPALALALAGLTYPRSGRGRGLSWRELRESLRERLRGLENLAEEDASPP